LLIPSSTWSWVNDIKRSSEIPAEEFADRILAQLTTDFDTTLEAIKTQRLLTASRSRQHVAAVCSRIAEKAASMPVLGKRRSVLKRHCAAKCHKMPTRRSQRIYDNKEFPYNMVTPG